MFPVTAMSACCFHFIGSLVACSW